MIERCSLCDNQGWQKFEINCPTMRSTAKQVRACGCVKAPDKQRKPDPLSPPDWARSDDWLWLPQTVEAALKFECNCYNCKPWLYENKATR